ncbi:PTS beta-glucoside transporter subunit IIABC [Paenibacillus sp. VT-400]|nr:PTS beta-glucoside transporter subunit IIABC [Paenibacillus sp. VT-400]
MSHNELAKEIIQLIGGEKNVSGLTHCATRLRFNLKDNGRADKETLKKLNGVLTVVEGGGQFQVVIGNDVGNVYNEITKMTNLNTENLNDDSEKVEKTKLSSRIFETISGSFSPLLPAFAGAGMLKALLTVLVLLGWLSTESGSYAILSAAGNGVFYFLPILLGITLAIKLGGNPYVAAGIGAALMEPNFTGLMTNTGDISDFAGIPVVLMIYSSTVFPIIIAISAYIVLDRFLKKVILKSLQFFLVPMISLLIIVPLTVMALGPIGVYVGNGIGVVISFLSGQSGLLTGALIGATITFLVVLGLQWGLIPIMLSNIAVNGGDHIGPMWAAATFAQMGIAFGVFLKSKDKKIKSLAGSSALTGILAGVTEPIVYGLILKYKRTLPLLMISGAVGGGIIGFFRVTFSYPAFHSIFTIPVFSPIGLYVVGIASSFSLAAVLVVMFGFNGKKAETNLEKSDNQVSPLTPVIDDRKQAEEIGSPLSGEVKPLDQVDDVAFSSGAMGKGIAIEPSEGRAISPVDGIVSTIFKTSHAIVITSRDGAEILIHIGINTVKLKGKYFAPKVQAGDQVKQGDLLVEFDIEEIKAEGYQVTTPIIVTNSDQYLDVVRIQDPLVFKPMRL